MTFPDPICDYIDSRDDPRLDAANRIMAEQNHALAAAHAFMMQQEAENRRITQLNTFLMGALKSLGAHVIVAEEDEQ